jgi:dephospho-CoA kinase
MILGVTGGLGCGKSIVVESVARHGFVAIDSDKIIREEILTRVDVIAAIRTRFGDHVVSPAGTVDRFALGEIVFADDEARLWLEQLTHPLLFAQWRAKLGALPMARRVVEVPLLFEKQLENWFDFIVCVTCAPNQQLARLEQRGLTRAQAAQRISKQLPLAHKIELSDFVVLNDGSPDFLQKQIDLLVEDALPVASL